MEYSPMLLVVLWALTPSDCASTSGRSSTSGEVARVQEMPRPTMTIQHPVGPRAPGYFTFNNGQPFLADKDPLTGVIDYNLKTTPVTKQPAFSQEFYYDDDEEFPTDPIDRKDGVYDGTKPTRQNDIKGSTKSQDLHKFLNLPVHYSTKGKFPLISSSYANTKVQGHGSGTYSNHRPASSTPSTVSPSYYSLKPSSPTTEPVTSRTTSTTTTTTTTPKPTTPTTTSRPSTYPPPPPPPPNPNYPEYEYADYDYDKLFEEPSSTTTRKPLITTYKPTFKTTSTTQVPTTTTTTTTTTAAPTTVSTTRATTTTTTTTTTAAPSTTERPVSIVNPKIIERPVSTTEDKFLGPLSYGDRITKRPVMSSDPAKYTTTPPSTTNQPPRVIEAQGSQHEDQVYVVTYRPRPQEGITYGRPDIKPGEGVMYGRPQIQEVEGVKYGRPQDVESIQYGRPEAPEDVKYGRPDETVKYGQYPPGTNRRPVVRPPPFLPLSPEVQEGKLPRPPFRPPQPPKPVYETTEEGIEMGPGRKPEGPDSHLIQVGPSYSLQTSFSIGVPPREGQGVGQVLFPEEEPQERPVWPASPARPLLTQGQGTVTVGIPPQGSQVTVGMPPRTEPAQSSHVSVGLPVQPHQGQGPPSAYPGQGLRPPPPHTQRPYPRPPWESHIKHPYPYAPNSLQKKDVLPSYIPPKRVRPHPSQRVDLPNILPQFRPNAKVGQDYPAVRIPPKPREPFDTLQPPPLPRPQFLRLNPDSDEESEEETPGASVAHRRTGTPGKSNPPRRGGYRVEETKDDVFLVYPSKGGLSQPSNEGVVVVGTRGPHQPLPPDTLDDLDTFPLDEKPFPLAREREDTPILKTKATPRPVKPEFPYAIVKPEQQPAETEYPEYNAFSPTPASTSTEALRDHDSEINVIPYLQDYMPYATRKPLGQSTSKPISVTLDTLLASKSTTLQTTTTEARPISSQPPASGQTLVPGTSSGSELTLGSSMVAPHHDPPPNPQPQDFQAPFMPSNSEPNGWAALQAKSNSTDKEEATVQTSPEPTNFDIENFKPVLFGGFKPIIPTEDPRLNEPRDRQE